MATSRIFVKNLPPNLKEDDFKEYFSNLAPVTDARLIPKRRIGYVGYKTAEIALKAIKYYHKSFIRMSKIHVELAKSVDESQPRKKARFQDSVILEPPSEVRAQRHDDLVKNPKLQEFLSTMAPASRGKTWANEDALADGSSPVAFATMDGDQASEDEYQTISKKRKRNVEHEEVEKREVVAAFPNSSEPQVTVVSDSGPKIAAQVGTRPDGEESVTLEVMETGLPPIAAASDDDWLRSRTNRLLDLVDDDEFDDRKQTVTARLESPRKVVSDDEKHKEMELEETPDLENMISNARSPDTSEDISPENPNTGRLFIRNLSYSATDAELQAVLAKYGSVEEIHISRDPRTETSKGFGYARFSKVEEAQAAQKDLDGKSFQGRLLHILQAKDKKPQGLDEYEISKLPLKKQREIRRKAEASTSVFKWNSMYMNPDAILSSVATRLGVPKIDLMDPTSSDAAVKQAHAETNIVKGAKAYFATHGVNLDAFKSKEYSDRAILVKNFPYGTSAEELKKMFESHGNVSRLLMPPSATIAVVEMERATQARSAFQSLAYRKFKDSVLFLEKAPKTLFTSDDTIIEAPKPAASDLLAQEESNLATATKATLFVRNLNFSTTALDLRDLFMPLQGFLSATVKTKTDAKRPGQTLSMGFGFVEFQSREDAQSATTAMNGYKLAGHELMIKESNKAIDAAEERRKEDAAKKSSRQRTKIVIRNLPFEATKKDVRSLFGPYGQLRTVRVPKKFDNTSRGFAFAEFVTSREAENASKSLAGVHLLGRRLNLEFAAGDTLDAEEEIEKMSKKIRKQADKVAIQNLAGGGRKKFSARQGEEDVD